MNSKLEKLTSFFCDFTRFERSRYVPTECLSPKVGLCVAGGGLAVQRLFAEQN